MSPGEKNKNIPSSFEETRFLEVCRLLNEEGARYLVIGGLACALHGMVRATKDVDLLIPKDPHNAEKVLKALGGLTFGIARELDPEEVAKKPFTIIGDTPRVDLLTVACRVKYDEASKKALIAIVDGVKIPYVDYDTLVETKKTERLQDKADLERLEQIKGKP